MLELLLLGDILDTYNDKSNGIIKIEGIKCDYTEIINRYQTLINEFISPYVIDNNSKE